MKKLVSAMLIAMLSFSSVSTAFAAPSVTDENVIISTAEILTNYPNVANAYNAIAKASLSGSKEDFDADDDTLEANENSD